MKYNEVLKELRISKQLTQEELANILNINRVQYNQYENDYNTIPIKHLINLSNYFQVSIDYIFNLTPKAKDIYSKTEITPVIAGIRLKEFRKDQGLTQQRLAQILNTNQSVIANYERGRTFIATSFLYTICKKYNVSADYLLGKTDEPKYLK